MNTVKKGLKRSFFAYFLIFSLITAPVIYSGNEGLSVGETVPNPEFIPMNAYDYDQMPRPVRINDYKEDKNMLIAFMPSIKSGNKYANVMTSAFDTYFAEGLAFMKDYDMLVQPGELKVLIVTNNNEAEVKDYLEKMNLDFDMVADANLDMSHFFGVTKWDSEGDGSLVYVVNKENKVVYASYDYKGEGEKLKSVQKELFTLYDIKDNSFAGNKTYSPLMPGDDARNFEFDYIYTGAPTAGLKTTEHAELSDYIGKKNVVIAFYPAAFSYSCGMEVNKFNTFAEDNMIQNVINGRVGNENDVEVLMVSQSNTQILKKWSEDMGIKNLKLVVDNTGEISAKYSSYNMLGYNKRTLFIIDKSGKVSYIDWDYQVDDEDFALMKEHLSSID